MMKKHVICVLLAFVLLFGTASCAAQTKEDGDAWRSAYRNYLNGEYQKREEAKASGEETFVNEPRFDLFYMDNDDVPEMIVTDSDAHAGTATLVTWSDGMLRAFPDLGSNGMVFYNERSNQIVGYYVGSGTSAFNVYHLEDGNLITDWSGVEQDSTWILENGTVNYFSFDVSVDQTAFESHYNRFVPEWFSAMQDPFDEQANGAYFALGTTPLRPEMIEQGLGLAK